MSPTREDRQFDADTAMVLGMLDDLPPRQPCPSCDGKGYVYVAPGLSRGCPVCHPDTSLPSPDDVRGILKGPADPCPRCASLLATAPDLAAARDKIRELNRRCQSAEAGLAEKVNAHAGPSLGRSLANAAGVMYREQYRELLAAVRAYLAARSTLDQMRGKRTRNVHELHLKQRREDAYSAALAALRAAAGEP